LGVMIEHGGALRVPHAALSLGRPTGSRLAASKVTPS
jgi:hypothetical protein